MIQPRDLEKYYSDYLDGSLDESSRRRFQEILLQHPELQKDYETFVRTQQLVAGLETVDSEDGFEAKVLARLQPARWTTGLLSWPVMAAVAAAFSLLAVLALFVLSVPDAGNVPTPSVAQVPGTSPASPELPPLLEQPLQEEFILAGDLELAMDIHEVSTLIEEINRLQEEFYLEDDGIVLHASPDQELVLQPSAFYQAAVAARRDSTEKDDIRHAY